MINLKLKAMILEEMVQVWYLWIYWTPRSGAKAQEVFLEEVRFQETAARKKGWWWGSNRIHEGTASRGQENTSCSDERRIPGRVPFSSLSLASRRRSWGGRAGMVPLSSLPEKVLFHVVRPPASSREGEKDGHTKAWDQLNEKCLVWFQSCYSDQMLL